MRRCSKASSTARPWCAPAGARRPYQRSNGSPRAASESAAGARVFLDGFRKARPDWDIDVMNLWRDHLPEFEGHVLDAKYARMNARAFTDPQREAFAVAERVAIRLALADR